MVAVARPLTYKDLERTPDDGKRYELLGGELYVTASPIKKHIRITFRLARMIHDFADETGLGEVFPGPADVKLTPYDVVVPDITFLSTERLSMFGDKLIEGPPDLIVEVLSPSTRKRDLTQKRLLYARTGVAEYWTVDVERSSITVNVLNATGSYDALTTTGDLLTSPVLPGFELSLTELFRGI